MSHHQETRFTTSPDNSQSSFQRITQRLSSMCHMSWLALSIFIFLAISLVLIGPFFTNQAMATSAVFPASSRHSITSGERLFFVIFLVPSLISFIIGYIMSLQPIFIHPIGKTRVRDKPPDSVANLIFASTFMLTIPLYFPTSKFLLSLLGSVSLGPWKIGEVLVMVLVSTYPSSPEDQLPWIWDLLGGMLSLAFWVSLWFFMWIFLSMIEYSLIRYLTGREGESIRPLYCANCKNKLKKLDSFINMLNEGEKTAMQIKSSTFEAWQCRKCYPENNRESIHLRVYRMDSQRFNYCPDCREITMTLTSSKILEKATISSEGRMLLSYTCNYCSRKEVIPRIIPAIHTDM